jgi:hypothetical protein
MRRTALGVLAVLLVLAGCGAKKDASRSAEDDPTTSATSAGTTSSPGPAGTPTTDPSAAPGSGKITGVPSAEDNRALKAAVTAYSDAFLTGNANVSYALLSTRCRAATPKANWDALLVQAKQAFGKALPITTFEARVSGDRAQVSYTYALAKIDQHDQPWVRESGHWFDDRC